MTPVILSVAESKVTHTTFKVKVVIILGRVHDAQTQQESGPEATACCSPRRMLDKGERCLDETKQTRKRQSPRHQRGCNQRWPDVTGPAVTEKPWCLGRSLLGGDLCSGESKQEEPGGLQRLQRTRRILTKALWHCGASFYLSIHPHSNGTFIFVAARVIKYLT